MTRLAPFAALILCLAGCVSPQKIDKTRADMDTFNAERQARDANQQCSETAMPGTVEHLACRMAKTKGAQ
jgi:outer membrane murein-binding lipoprotein Lpp